VVAPARYSVIDDEMFDVATAAETDGARLTPQGATLDSNSLSGNVKFTGWESGVIPIEFDANVTAAQRDQFMQICNSTWGSAAFVMCISRTSQFGFLRVSALDNEPNVASPCHSAVGQSRRLVEYQLNLGTGCWNQRNITHELGHAFGFIHEHQRPDRDSYLTVDLSNVPSNAQSNFSRLSLFDSLGPYDFLSVMHYRSNAFAIDTSKPTMVPKAGYTSFADTMGTSTTASDLDRAAIGNLYNHYFRPFVYTGSAPTTRFDRNDFLDAMERLHEFYYSRLGLNRPSGLSISAKPDFLGIATWIFDVYLGARSRGFSPDLSFSIVVADITQTDEWRSKHVGWAPITRQSFTPVVSFDRAEFLTALQNLDAFYSAREGLQRPNGLSIGGGPDFLGIAAWVFDVYLSERLSGGSSNLAWTRVVNAIQNTQEWKSKH
jgi:Astacin (Peptidase family M12A)